MPEPRQPFDPLEQALMLVGDGLDYPPASAVAPAVISRLREEHVRSPVRGILDGLRDRWRLAPRPAWSMVTTGVAVVLVLLGGIVIASPSAREAVAGWLGLRGVRITQTPHPTLTPGAFSELRLGERVTLDEAMRLVDYRILLPEGLMPGEVYVQAGIPGGQVSLVYGASAGLPRASETGAGLLLTQFRGQVDRPQIDKVVQQGEASVDFVVVNGGPGFWISGRPHFVSFVDENGVSRQDTVRLAGNVLMWEQGGLTLRLESALSLDRALEIAEIIG
jgi:hypothetical protein